VNIELLSALIVVAMVALLLLGLPFAFTLGFIGIALSFYVWGGIGGLSMVGPRIFGLMGDYVLIAVPMFVFMAAMLEKSGIAEDLYTALYQWLGGLRGGLASATIVACTIMAAITGIIGAGIVTMGMIALPPMLKRGYNKRIALGSVMAGGCLGTLIPPSVPMVVYGMEAGVSIGRLFLAGIMPGLLLSGLFVAYISVRSALQPQLCPSLPKEERISSFIKKLSLSKNLILPVGLIIVILGSIYGGIAGITEVSGIGAAGAIVCAAVRHSLSWENLKEVCYTTIRTTCMVLWLYVGASLFVSAYMPAGGGEFLSSLVVGLDIGPRGILVIMVVIFMIMGMFLDWLPILLLTMPVFAPVVSELGFNLVWFGILYMLAMQTAYLTPPFGGAMFYLRGVTPSHITMREIVLSVPPFVALQVIGLVLVFLFPQIAMWLPSMSMG